MKNNEEKLVFQSKKHKFSEKLGVILERMQRIYRENEREISTEIIERENKMKKMSLWPDFWVYIVIESG